MAISQTLIGLVFAWFYLPHWAALILSLVAVFEMAAVS